MFKSKAAVAALLVPRPCCGCAREGDIYRDRHPGDRIGLPGGRRFPAPTGDITLFNPPTSRDAERDRRRRHDHQRPQHLRRDRRIYRHQCDLRRARPSAAIHRGAREVDRCPISPPSCRAAAMSSPSSVSRVGLRLRGRRSIAPARPAPRPRRCCARRRPCPRTSASRSPASASPAIAEAALDPMADPAVRAAVDRAPVSRCWSASS